MPSPDSELGPRSCDELAFPDRKTLAPHRHPPLATDAPRGLDLLRIHHRQSRQTLDTQTLGKRRAIHDAVTQWRHLDLMVAPGMPLGWVRHHAGTDHVAVDVDDAARQVLAGFEPGGAVGATNRAVFRWFGNSRYQARDFSSGNSRTSRLSSGALMKVAMRARLVRSS